MGKRPVVRFKRGYKWTYLYGFVRPESGEVFYWLVLPTANMGLFSMALREEFAKEVGAAEQRRILLVVDRAGWHTPAGRLGFQKGYILSSYPLGLPGAYASGEVVAPD